MSDMSFTDLMNLINAPQHKQSDNFIGRLARLVVNNAMPEDVRTALGNYQAAPDSLSARQGVFSALYQDNPNFAAGLAGKYGDYDSLANTVWNNYLSQSPEAGELLKGLNRLQSNQSSQQQQNNGAGVLAILNR